MGMRINSASTSQATSQTSGASNWQQRQQGFKDLLSSLQSGDLDAAKQAFATLSGGKSTAVQGDSPLAQLGQALQAGDISAAQQAAQTLQAARSGHHHHQSQATDTAAEQAIPSASASGLGALVNVAV